MQLKEEKKYLGPLEMVMDDDEEAKVSKTNIMLEGSHQTKIQLKLILILYPHQKVGKGESSN